MSLLTRAVLSASAAFTVPLLEVLTVLHYLISIFLAIQTPPTRRPRLNRPVRRKVRPVVECLEDRINPAPHELLWVGGDGGAWNLDKNWIVMSGADKGKNFAPAAGDNLTFDPAQTVNGTKGSNLSTATTTSPISVGDLTIAKAYTQIVTIDRELKVNGTLMVRGGTLTDR